MRRLAPWRHFVAALLAVAGTGLVLEARNRAEVVPPHAEFRFFPTVLGGWTGSDVALSPGELAVLGPGDFLLRDYARGNENPVSLFIAYYPSQRSGDTIHSPRNCLPGAGWMTLTSGLATLYPPGQKPLTVNRYVVGNGDARMFVLYWYAAHGRTVTNEYARKLFVVADAIRLNRTDGALIRAAVAFGKDSGEGLAEKQAAEFVERLAPLLDSYNPR
jgi:EpsI family protein